MPTEGHQALLDLLRSRSESGIEPDVTGGRPDHDGERAGDSFPPVRTDVPDALVDRLEGESRGRRGTGLEVELLEALEQFGGLARTGREPKVQLGNFCSGNLASVGDLHRDGIGARSDARVGESGVAACDTTKCK